MVGELTKAGSSKKDQKESEAEKWQKALAKILTVKAMAHRIQTACVMA